MRIVRCIAPALAAAAMLAGEPAAAPVQAPLIVRIADGAQLNAHWDASIYAKVWADPAAKALRTKWAASLKEAEGKVGFNPLDAIAAAKGIQMQFFGLQGELPKLIFRADLGTFATKVLAAVVKEQPDLKAVKVAGADEAFSNGKGTLARFGTVFVAAAGVDPSAVGPAAAAPADAAIEIDGQRLVDSIASAIPEEKKAQFDKIITQLRPYLGTWSYRGDIVPEGIRERLSGQVPSPGVQPVDRSLLARLPENTMLTLTWGFDGKSYWKAGGEAMLSQLDESMHPGAPVGTQATAKEIEASLQQLNLKLSLQQIVEGLTGTGIFALTPGALFPAVTIVLPRSPATDQLIEVGMPMIGNAAPAEGQSAQVAIPNVPVPITLLRDKSGWVVTSDMMLAASWSTAQPGGFLDSPAAKTLFAKAPAHSYLLGAADTPTVLRTLQGYLGIFLKGNQSLTQEEKLAITGALTRLAGSAATGYIYAAADANHTEAEVRGLIGSGTVPVFVAAAVLSGMKNNEAEVVGMDMPEAPVAAGPDRMVTRHLSADIFPAEIQFQAGGYCDQDGNHIGEYGTLAELAGLVPAPGQPKSEMLLKDWKAGAAVDGYRFAVYLPNGKGGALSADAEARPANKAAASAQERGFVAYAWPAEPKGGERMFAIDQTGVVYADTFTGQAPAWNALYGGQGWDGIPAWQPAAH